MGIKVKPDGLRSDHNLLLRTGPIFVSVSNVSSQIPRVPSASFQFPSHCIYQDSPSTTSPCGSLFTVLCFCHGFEYESQRKPLAWTWYFCPLVLFSSLFSTTTKPHLNVFVATDGFCSRPPPLKTKPSNALVIGLLWS